MKVVTRVALLVLAVLVFDQTLKFWVKTHMYYGQSIAMIGSWFQIHFVENEGMAWGKRLDDMPGLRRVLNPQSAKLLLTIFRLVAVVFIGFLLRNLITKKVKKGLIYSLGLILAGALGNIIDSVFYGRLFSASYSYPDGIAKFLPKEGGYAPLFQGKVVDMFHFPIINPGDFYFPEWLPLIGNTPFVFFNAIFNVADSAISIGIFLILIFHRSYFRASSKEMTIIKNIQSFVTKPAQETMGETPEGLCPNCWGKQEYDNQIRQLYADHQIDVNNYKAHHTFIRKFVVKHIEGIRLRKEKKGLRCSSCE